MEMSKSFDSKRRAAGEQESKGQGSDVGKAIFVPDCDLGERTVISGESSTIFYRFRHFRPGERTLR